MRTGGGGAVVVHASPRHRGPTPRNRETVQGGLGGPPYAAPGIFPVYDRFVCGPVARIPFRFVPCEAPIEMYAPGHGHDFVRFGRIGPFRDPHLIAVGRRVHRALDVPEGRRPGGPVSRTFRIHIPHGPRRVQGGTQTYETKAEEDTHETDSSVDNQAMGSSSHEAPRRVNRGSERIP